MQRSESFFGFFNQGQISLGFYTITAGSTNLTLKCSFSNKTLHIFPQVIPKHIANRVS